MFYFDEATFKGRDVMEGMLKSHAELSKGIQTITAEAADYSRKSYEDGVAHAEALTSVRSPQDFFTLQSDYARSAWEAAIEQMTRMSALYADLGKVAYKSFETPVTAKSGPVAKARQVVAEVVHATEDAISAA